MAQGFAIGTGGTGNVSATANLTDNAVVRGDGGVKGVQTSSLYVSDAGEMTNTLQPAFLAYNSVQRDNQTGNGAGIDYVQFDTEVFDQGADYDNATYIFTAPTTGRYRMMVEVNLLAVTAAMNNVYSTFNTSNHQHQITKINVGAVRNSNNEYVVANSALIDMDAADQAFVYINVFGGAGNTVGFAASGGNPLYTYFSGQLEC
jgi:hypothetical protein